eukprot:SAG22_NODE_805_length_7096_cov_28.481206_8_plen_93_part_00
MGATKYMGDDRSVFEEAVSTREPGLYTCQISHDEIVTLMLPVESAMHVSIVVLLSAAGLALTEWHRGDRSLHTAIVSPDNERSRGTTGTHAV